MTTPIFDPEKATEALLFVAERLESKDMHRISKVLYFADREHLAKYGRPVTCDTYIKMEYGPVPSNIYNTVKDVRDGRDRHYTNTLGKVCSCSEAFAAKESKITPLRSADLDFLSQTDVEELEASVNTYGKLSFDELTSLSHGAAWEEATPNRPISMESILREAGESEDSIDYITYFFKAERAIIG
jgi:uncharacterized phage-associated protein